MIHACDIDNEALMLAKVVLWISAGCPENGLRLNLSHGDSLEAGPCKNTSMWFDHTNLPPVEGYDCVVGNPYVRVKPELIGRFVFKTLEICTAPLLNWGKIYSTMLAYYVSSFHKASSIQTKHRAFASF